MTILLHSPHLKTGLSAIYRKAFLDAKEIFVVSAYLTEWDKSLILSKDCQYLRIVVGQDFGITRKKACADLGAWLPKAMKANFLVATGITGFHPKAMFWEDHFGKFYSLIGSSNLTRAAFETNYEANSYVEIKKDEYRSAKDWLAIIEKLCIVVSPNWIDSYQEAQRQNLKLSNKVKPVSNGASSPFDLPAPENIIKLLKDRRKQLQIYENGKEKLITYFRKCAVGKMSNESFFSNLSTVWSIDIGNRLQGEGWERRGKASRFNILCSSFIRILDAPSEQRDDVVIKELDFLLKEKVPSRGAFLSEMLCLAFPDSYPVLNAPVKKYLKKIKFRAPRGVGDGGKFIDLSKRLRISLLMNPGYPAKSIAELDAVIWKIHQN